MDSQQFPPPPPAPAPKSRIPIIFATALSGLIFLILGFFLGRSLPSKTPVAITTPTPTPNETSSSEVGWQTYINEQFGLSINYPNDFIILTQDKAVDLDFSNNLISIEKQNSFPGTALKTRFVFQVRSVSEAKTPQSCYVSSADNSALVNAKTITGNTFYFSDKSSGAALGTHNANQEYKVFKDTGDLCFGIYSGYFESSDWNSPQDSNLAKASQEEWSLLFDQILSTFKFPDQKPVTYVCNPKFVVETGPELTASEVYSQACYRATSQGECEKVDVYRKSTQNFGNADGVPDCKWISQ